MDGIFDIAKAIVREDVARETNSYRRLVDMIVSGRDITLCDVDLAKAAREAVDRGEVNTARLALNELELRLTGDQPVRTAA